MRNHTFSGVFALIFMSLFISATLPAQDKASRLSPPATASGKVGAATITIDYSSPAVKGRTVWGELVPYGKPWRAGANEATTFQTDNAITVEGKTLPAGKYTPFAIPTANEWTFIFNSQLGQWGIKQTGEANFDPAKNVLTVTAKPMKSASMNERLAYVVTNNGFAFRWENLEVPVLIK
jgi:hypothetical protein